MSKRFPSAVVHDILNCIDHLQVYTNNLSFDDFSSNFMVVEACLYNIQIIGEAVAHLDENIKKAEPQIPWSLIKGMRNKLIHEYFGTDLEIVWKVIVVELPSFKSLLKDIHKKLVEQGR